MSETAREHPDGFWELLDELLNAVLFVLIGLEVLILSFQYTYLLAGRGGGGHHHVCGGGLLDPCAGAHDQPGVGIRREHQERG